MKYNIKRQKDTQEKKKRKMTDVHCKEGKVLDVLSVQNILWNWFSLVQLSCLNQHYLIRLHSRIFSLQDTEEGSFCFFFLRFLQKIFIFIRYLIPEITCHHLLFRLWTCKFANDCVRPVGWFCCWHTTSNVYIIN